ncbi:endonuclease domain-containing 1 protein-like [Arapaima gigas]
MWCILNIDGSMVLLLSLAALSIGVFGEVGNFSSCSKYFFGGIPPQGLGVKGSAQICQRYMNTYHFASLYSRVWRTPLYSAYLFVPGGKRRPRTEWKYEPQLASTQASPEMMHFPPGPVDQNVEESQAVLQDYKNSSYTKGHLSPNSHHLQELDKKATFTLTNIVPQKLGSNSGPWAVLENEVATRLSTYCTREAYIVTGVLPYTSAHWINNRVAVPEYLWSAYCCPLFSADLPEELRTAFPAFAAIGRNDPLSDEDIVPVNPKKSESIRGYDVRRMSVKTLEMYLQKRLGGTIQIFLNRCNGTMAKTL